MVTGVILAGGKNSRIGLNKASLTLGDKTFIEHIAAALNPFCGELIVISKEEEEFPYLTHSRVIPTISKVVGPMAGVWMGLKAAQTEYVFCAACDIPFIHPGIVAEIIGAITPGIQAVVPRYNGYLEPLCAVYAQSCLDVIGHNLTEDSYSIQLLLDNLFIKEIAEDTLRKHDPEGYTFFNINHPEDYSKAKKIYNLRSNHIESAMTCI